MVTIDMSNINATINETIDKLKSYIESLNEKEKIAWILIVAGVLLVILSLVMW